MEDSDSLDVSKFLISERRRDGATIGSDAVEFKFRRRLRRAVQAPKRYEDAVEDHSFAFFPFSGAYMVKTLSGDAGYNIALIYKCKASIINL